MRGRGRAAGFLAATAIFAGACTLGGNSTIPTAQISPESSPSSTTSSNPATTSPPATAPSPESSPSAAGLAVASLPVHNGEVGIGYLAVNFQAGGGTAPYTWTVAGGAFPPGLTLSTAGILTGNNTKAGSYTFNVKVTDTSGQVATGQTSLKVFPPLSVSQPCVNLCYVGLTCTTCGRFGVVSGGAGPYQYKLVSGVIPTGMSLNGLLLNGPWPVPTVLTVPTDTLTIGPILRGFPWSLGVQVTDDFGATKTVSANWLEFYPIGMPCSTGTICATCGTTSCTGISYFGGSPSDNVTVAVTQVCDTNNANCVTGAGIANALPPGWSATANGGTVTIGMDCSTLCPNGFQANVFIALVDHGACVAPAYVKSPSVIVSIDA